MSATLYRSGAFWRLDFLWADMDKSLVFKTAKDARLFAKHWRFRVVRANRSDRPEKLCADIRYHLGLHGPYDRDLTD